MASLSDSSFGSVKSIGENDTAPQKVAWPLRNVSAPGDNDCLLGRGGGSNHHPGNKRWRKMIDDNKQKYRALAKTDKNTLSLQMVSQWRNQNPPGRFLKLDEETKLWNDAGDEEARVKCSQALREKRISGALQVSDGNKPSKKRASNSSLLSDSKHSRRSSDTTHASELSAAESLTLPVSTLPVLPAVTSSAALHHMPAVSCLASCFVSIGVDTSLLSGQVEEEFATIKMSYVKRVAQASASGDHSAIHYAHVAFEVLRTLLHKLRATHSSFQSLVAATSSFGSHDYIKSLWSASFYNSHLRNTSSGISPHTHIELAGAGGCSCCKCGDVISPGCLQISEANSNLRKCLGCWEVPPEILQGLSAESVDTSVTLRDLNSMDELLLTGLPKLDFASQMEFAHHASQQLLGRKMSNETKLETHTLAHGTELIQSSGDDEQLQATGPLKKRHMTMSPGNEWLVPQQQGRLASLSLEHEHATTRGTPNHYFHTHI